MDEKLFEAIFLVGLFIATIIRSYFGAQFRRKEIAHKQREHPMVFIGMALWGIALVLPLFSIFSPWLMFADYNIPVPLSVIGAVLFIGSLWLLWRSHADLEKNFSPSLFIRNHHTLVTSGVYKRIRHPMYCSFWLWGVGQALDCCSRRNSTFSIPGVVLIPNWIAGPLGLIAFFFIYLFRVEREEQQLIETFGDEYRDYQKRTGKLFPVGL